MAKYLAPDALVDTTWLSQHGNNANLRVVECDVDAALYGEGHIPGAVKLDCQTELVNRNTRDLISLTDFEKLAGRLGISETHRVVFYGDQHNIMACYAYWVFKQFGHDDLKVLDGGRDTWLANGLTLTRETPTVVPVKFKARRIAQELRALRDDVLDHIGNPDPTMPSARMDDDRALVDDRTREEFEGVFAMDSGYPPRFLRSGHIPGAANVPYLELLSDDGTFKSIDEIKKILGKKGVTAEKDTVVYTRIGERASLMWFVMHELLGYPKVRTYDGSWTEWGNTIGLPIEAGKVVPISARHGHEAARSAHR
jgi:thiosulfate/3-mercaptopyruvate sulfurtransferase